MAASAVHCAGLSQPQPLVGRPSGVACPSHGDGHATRCTSSQTSVVQESAWNGRGLEPSCRALALPILLIVNTP